MNEIAPSRRFFLEVFPLLSTLVYGEQVQLDAMSVGTESDSASDEMLRFADVVRTRHDIACGLRLKPVLQAIEQRASDTSVLSRIESKGVIRGRLDIPQYLARRARSHSWPRTYPIIVTADSPNTPENRLVRETLCRLSRRLASANISRNTAERRYSMGLYRWINDRARRQPWVGVAPHRSVERLRLEVEHRIWKRQTGNEPAYGAFLRWLDEWQVDPTRLTQEAAEHLATGWLAFPFEAFFWDKVFEVWCLAQSAESLLRCGAIASAGPRPLTDRTKDAIYEFQYMGRTVRVWFQRSLPDAVWHYEHSGTSLRGVPDVTIDDGRASPLIVDAKNRLVTTKTRSEEAYKMLGYLENFRSYVAASGFFGVLCFVANNDLHTVLGGPHGGRLTLLGAHSDDPKQCSLASHLDAAIKQWLDRVA